MNKLLAGIDVGTTGVRCMLFDSQGNLVSGAYREYECNYLKPGWVEQDFAKMMAQTMSVCHEAICEGDKDLKILGLLASLHRGV